MKALILNSGLGSRMDELTKTSPKCMTLLCTGQTILSRQIEQLEQCGIKEIYITTGPFAEKLEQHAHNAACSASLVFVNNPEYATTNYIYSIFLAMPLICEDIILLHGDLVFSTDVLRDIITFSHSAAIVSSVLPLPQKDFKAMISDGFITAVGVEFFSGAMAMQPLYRMNKKDWMIWLSEIKRFVERGEKKCYAENALNVVGVRCSICPFDIKHRFCAEIDTPEDLDYVNATLMEDVGK